MQDLDITPRMATVLKIFLEDPGQSRYGFELMKLTGMASGSLYPMLARLEAAGWLTRGKESIDPRAAGLPWTNYVITGGSRQRRPRPASRTERAVPAAGSWPPPVAGQHRVSAFLLGVLSSIAGGLTLAVFGEMLSQEIRDRLDHLPHVILRLAARRLGPAQRVILHEEVWLPDLAYHLRGDEARPITRLYHGIRFALGMLVSAHRSSQNLDGAAQKRHFRIAMRASLCAVPSMAHSTQGGLGHRGDGDWRLRTHTKRPRPPESIWCNYAHWLRMASLPGRST